jgi:two-component sensor histidine kinase
MAKWSFRKFLLASVLVLAILPVITFFGLTTALIHRHIIADIEGPLGAIAASAATEAALVIDEPRRVLGGLETFLSKEPLSKALDSYLDAAVSSSAAIGDLAVLDSRGRIVAASAANRSHLGEDLSGQPAFAKAMADADADGSPVLTSPFVNPADGTVTVLAFKRFPEGALAAYLKLDEFSRFLVLLRFSDADRLALIDGIGFVIAHTDPSFVSEQRFIKPPGPGITRIDENSRTWLATSRTVPGHDWRVIYYRDADESYAISGRLGLYLGLVGVASLALALVLAMLMRASFSKPFYEIISRMRMMTAGRYDERIRGNYAEEFSRIADAFNGMADQVSVRESRITRELEEKTVLLREVHHRVKNNLQIMSSLLNLETQNVRDPADLAIMQAGQDRIYSMSLVHELLYQTEDLRSIEMSSYAEQLTSYLLSTRDREGLEVATELESVVIPLEKALSCGLILNEMLTNALKYGVKGTPTPFLGIRLKVEEGKTLMLEVRDRGPGFKPSEDPRMSKSLGFSLIINLAKQLEGSVEFLPTAPGEAWPGLTARIRFPCFKDASGRPESAT